MNDNKNELIMNEKKDVKNKKNGWVVDIAVVMCLLFNFYLNTSSISELFSFDVEMLHLISFVLAFIIIFIPTYIMVDNGDFFSRSNRKWRISLYAVYLFLFVARFVTGRDMVSIMTIHQFYENKSWLMLIYGFSALLLTTISILTSILCFYLKYKEERKEDLDYYEQKEEELNSLREKIENGEISFEQNDLVLQTLDYKKAYFELMKTALFMAKLGESPEKIQEFINKADEKKKLIEENAQLIGSNKNVSVY